MLEKTNKNIFIIFSILRILLSIVLIFSNINILYKFIGILILDYIDGNRFYDNYIYSKELVKTPLYQYQDKLNDTFIYIILFLYILFNKEFNDNQTVLIGILLVFRIIGTLSFLDTLNRKYLFYFPNFFVDIGLLYSITNYFKITSWNSVAFIPTIIFTLVREYIHHY